MTIPPSVLAFFKQAWPYLLCLLLGGLWMHSCTQAAASEKEQQAILTKTTDSLKVLEKLAVHDTVILTHEITKLDTILRIRTVVLTKVDSAWMRSDSLIALVPPSDTACHVAYEGLKSGCELLKAQVTADTAIFRGLRDTLGAVQRDNVRQAGLARQAQARLDTLSSLKSCKILFVPCPSRTVTGILGLLGGFALGRH